LTFYMRYAIFLQSLYMSTNRPGTQTNLLQGTLDLLVMKALALGEMHGLGISRRIEQMTRGTFQVKPGSLFPALHRMEQAGWLTSSWGESENNRRAKYYRLTRAGRRRLDAEAANWGRISLAMASALEAT
jgi:PadR family transcriptional regulator